MLLLWAQTCSKLFKSVQLSRKSRAGICQPSSTLCYFPLAMKTAIVKCLKEKQPGPTFFYASASFLKEMLSEKLLKNCRPSLI